MTTPTTPITASVGEFVQHLERAAAIVRTWPEWKQRLLGGDASPTNDPEMDCTDFAHPAWWRGHHSGVASAAMRWREALDCTEPASGVMGEPLESLRRRTEALRFSPTAPRVEGGDFKNFHRLLCERFGYPHDERDWKRDQVSLMEHIAALIPTPPRERCEVCGGTQRVREYSDLTGYMNERVCPRCTKETPCDSGSGSSVVSRAGTNTQSDTKPASDVAASVTAASDPATVTGEGPYRVAYERANRMFYVVKPDGDRTCFGKRSIAQHAANLANHAHRTALAVREADIKELLAAFDDVNGRYIGGSPVNGRLGDEIENMAVVAMKIRARNALKGAAR
jgi:hypothetical protein